jgi:hypothetical protein
VHLVVCLFLPTKKQIYIYITTVSHYIMYTPTLFQHLCHPQAVLYLCVANLARHKCETPWWWHTDIETCRSVHYTGYSQKNGAVSKGNKSISHLTRVKWTPSAAATVQVSHALPAVCVSCLLRGHRVSFQDGIAAGKGFLCSPFWGVQICYYSAAWVLCTV